MLHNQDDGKEPVSRDLWKIKQRAKAYHIGPFKIKIDHPRGCFSISEKSLEFQNKTGKLNGIPNQILVK